MQHALRRGGKSAGGGAAVDVKIAIERSAGRNGHLPRQLIDRDNTVESERPQQRAAIVGIEPAGDAHDSRGRMRRLANCLAVEGETYSAQASAEVELGTSLGSRCTINGQDAVHFRRRQAVGERTECVRDLRRESTHDIGETGERRRIDVECQTPAWLRR